MVSPASTVLLSGFCYRRDLASFPARRSSDLSAVPSLVLVALAELLTVPHASDVVALVMCTSREPAGARSPKVQVSTPPLIEQSEFAGSNDQGRPDGSVSLTETPCAVPAPVVD